MASSESAASVELHILYITTYNFEEPHAVGDPEDGLEASVSRFLIRLPFRLWFEPNQWCSSELQVVERLFHSIRGFGSVPGARDHGGADDEVGCASVEQSGIELSSLLLIVCNK